MKPLAQVVIAHGRINDLAGWKAVTGGLTGRPSSRLTKHFPESKEETLSGGGLSGVPR